MGKSMLLFKMQLSTFSASRPASASVTMCHMKQTGKGSSSSTEPLLPPYSNLTRVCSCVGNSEIHYFVT